MGRHPGGRLFVALAAGTVVLAGCATASTPKSASSSPSTSTRGQTITVLDTEGHAQFLQVWAKIPQFEKKTGITVNLVKAPTTDDLIEKVLQANAAPTSAYDVMTIPDNTTGAAALHMTPLAPYIEQSGSTVAAFQANYPTWVDQADTFGGQVRYQPFYSGGVAIVYRKAMFDNAANKAAFQQRFGYALPDPPTTPQQLLNVAEFFTRNGNYGLVFPASSTTGDTMFEEAMWRAGLPFEDDQGYSLWGAHYPQNVKLATSVAAYMQNLIYKYKVAPPAVTGMETTDAGAYYATNCGTAMYMDLAYLTWSTVKSSASKCGALSSFAMPDFHSGGGSRVSYWMYGIPARSTHKEAAWQFIQWESSNQNIELAAEGPNGTFVPTNVTAAKAVVASGSIPVGVADAVKEGLHYPLLPETPAQVLQFEPYVEQLLGDKLTPAQFIAQTGALVDSLRAG